MLDAQYGERCVTSPTTMTTDHQTTLTVESVIGEGLQTWFIAEVEEEEEEEEDEDKKEVKSRKKIEKIAKEYRA